MKRKMAMILSTLMMLGLVVGCGGDDGAEKSGLGENCTQTDDCESDLKCLDMKCVLDDDTTDGDDTQTDGDTWTDSASGLTWQNPPSGNEMEWQGAIDYCDNLNLDGHIGWRLPTISELRSLIRGCPGTITGGGCGATDSCLNSSCHDSDCNDCSSGNGPAVGGCYWPVELSGTCSYYWSSSSVEDRGNNAWFVYFYRGFVLSGGVLADYYVRCVR